MGRVDASMFEKHQTSPQEEIEAIAAANQLNLAEVTNISSQAVAKGA